MTGNRDRALDAAIDLLGTRGLRGLTHRSVDTAAGLPQGSTSNYFRSRDALVGAVLVRLVEHDRADWAALGAARLPATLSELADGLSGFVASSVGPNRTRTTARFALVTAAATDPSLAEPISRARADLLDWGATMLAMLGSSEPARHGRIVADYLDGVILHQVTTPAPEFDPRPGIVTVLAAFFGVEPGRI